MPSEPTDAQVMAAIRTHLGKLQRRALDRRHPEQRKDAIRSLALMALLAEGWRPGGGGGETVEFNDAVVDLAAYRTKLVGKAA
jgi:hypothetical protein